MYIENLDLPHKILDRNIEIINKSVEKLLVAMGNHWDMTQDDEHLEVPWNLGHIAELGDNPRPKRRRGISRVNGRQGNPKVNPPGVVTGKRFASDDLELCRVQKGFAELLCWGGPGESGYELVTIGYP